MELHVRRSEQSRSRCVEFVPQIGTERPVTSPTQWLSEQTIGCCIVSSCYSGHGGLASTGKAVDLKWGQEVSSPEHYIPTRSRRAQCSCESHLRRGHCDVRPAYTEDARI